MDSSTSRLSSGERLVSFGIFVLAFNVSSDAFRRWKVPFEGFVPERVPRFVDSFRFAITYRSHPRRIEFPAHRVSEKEPTNRRSYACLHARRPRLMLEMNHGARPSALFRPVPPGSTHSDRAEERTRSLAPEYPLSVQNFLPRPRYREKKMIRAARGVR